MRTGLQYLKNALALHISFPKARFIVFHVVAGFHTNAKRFYERKGSSAHRHIGGGRFFCLWYNGAEDW